MIQQALTEGNISSGEWIEDPGVLEGKDVRWMNVALASDVDECLCAEDYGIATSDRSDDSGFDTPASTNHKVMILVMYTDHCVSAM